MAATPLASVESTTAAQQQQQHSPRRSSKKSAMMTAVASASTSSGGGFGVDVVRQRQQQNSGAGAKYSVVGGGGGGGDCPWLQADETAGKEPIAGADLAGTRAYLSPVVFEGKARSRSDGPIYRVTFDVVTVYKSGGGGGQQQLAGSQVRLEFATTGSSGGSSGGGRTGRGGGGELCLVPADVRTGRRYLVFAAHWGPNNLTAVAAPLLHTKKSVKDVRSVLCPRCARSPSAYGLDETMTAVKHGRLVLRCRTRGNPVPAVQWYKNGKRLPAAGTKRIRIKTKRRRSTLRIRCLKDEDAAVYECRPRNAVGPGVATRTRVSIIPRDDSQSQTTSSKILASLRPVNGSSSPSSLWPLIALPCPIDSFCLNGGTCKYYEAVGELVCQCAEGYKGQRCENKDIYNLATDSLKGQMEADVQRSLALYLGK